MSMLSRLIHRTDHEAWLAEHPDKATFHLPSGLAIDAAEQQRIRELMEREMGEAALRMRSGGANE